MKVNNKTAFWNCYDYIKEAIDRLYNKCIIDEKDKNYKKEKQSVVDSYYETQ